MSLQILRSRSRDLRTTRASPRPHVGLIASAKCCAEASRGSRCLPTSRKRWETRCWRLDEGAPRPRSETFQDIPRVNVKIAPRGSQEDVVSGKALSEMLQRLHEENQELQRVHQELNQRHSRKGSKEASKAASRNSPIQTPGGGDFWSNLEKVI